MAAPLIHPLGVADQAGFYTEWLRRDKLYDQLILRNLTYFPFDGQWNHQAIPACAYFLGVGYALHLDENIVINSDRFYTRSMAELLGPSLPHDLFLDQDPARERFVTCVTNLLEWDNLSSMTDWTPASTTRAQGDTDATLATLITKLQGIVEGEENIADLTFPEAVRVLLDIVENGQNRFKLSGLVLLTHVYVSVLKRGTVTARFLEKISQGMTADFGRGIDNWKEGSIQQFYNHFGTHITDVTIRDTTAHWSGLLPPQAIRLRNTVQQAANSGLTSLIIIGRAVRLFPTFSWARIQRLFDVEWENVIAAMNEVGNNQWYGFKKDLGNAKSTKFKSIAYVSKELLVKLNGEGSLNQYRGWANTVANQGVVDTLIAQYETRRTQAMLDPDNHDMPEDDQNDRVDAAREIIMNNAILYA